MLLYLKRNDVDFLKKYAHDAYEQMFDFKGEDEVHFYVKDVVEYQLDINDAIVDVGMDKQDTVNKIGKKLYEIYDELLYQIKHS